MLGKLLWFGVISGSVSLIGYTLLHSVELHPVFVDDSTAVTTVVTPQPSIEPTPTATPSAKPTKVDPTKNTQTVPLKKEVTNDAKETVQPQPTPEPQETSSAKPVVPVLKPTNPNHMKGANDCINPPSTNTTYSEFQQLMNAFDANSSSADVCNYIQIKNAIGVDKFTNFYNCYRKKEDSCQG